MSGHQTWTPKRGPYRAAKTSPYEGSTRLGPTTTTFCIAALKYSEPLGYRISLIFPLPLSKGKVGSLGVTRWTTMTRLSDSPPVRPELDILNRITPYAQNRRTTRTHGDMQGRIRKKEIEEITQNPQSGKP